MRKLTLIFLASLSLRGKAQTGDEDFFSEKDLQYNLHQAATITAQIEANGRLAVHYKERYEGSAGNIYLKRVYTLDLSHLWGAI